MMKRVYMHRIIVLFIMLASFTVPPSICDKHEKLENIAIINPKFQDYIDSARTYIGKNNTVS